MGPGRRARRLRIARADRLPTLGEPVDRMRVPGPDPGLPDALDVLPAAFTWLRELEDCTSPAELGRRLLGASVAPGAIGAERAWLYEWQAARGVLALVDAARGSPEPAGGDPALRAAPTPPPSSGTPPAEVAPERLDPLCARAWR